MKQLVVICALLLSGIPTVQSFADGPSVNVLNQLSPVADGLKSENYPDGTIKFKSNYKNGKLDGLTQNFDESGVLREEIHYINGVEEGEHKQFDDEGKLRAEWIDRNGKRDGKYRGYFSDGTISEERQYSSGAFLNADGQPYNGFYEVKYPDGKIYKKGSYKNGMADGTFLTYSPAGELETRIDYKNDLMDGLAQIFQEGRLVSEYQLVAGKKNGLGKEYNEDGGRWETMYVDAIAQGVARFSDAQNRLRATQEIKDGQSVGETIYFGVDGKQYPKAFVLDAEKHKLLFFGLWFIAFLFSLTVHEAAHAWAALKLGDETAYKGGQVSINPLPHIRREPIGMAVLPILTYWGQGWMMGWASAPYNPQWALEHPRRAALMALAGPVSNLILVVLTGIILRLGLGAGLFTFAQDTSATAIVGGVSGGLSVILASFFSILFFLNVVLFSFNLLPFPPLDGSGVIPLLLPRAWSQKYMAFINHQAVVVIGLITAWNIFNGLSDIIFGIFIPVLFLGT